jgi:hypothetical protein
MKVGDIVAPILKKFINKEQWAGALLEVVWTGEFGFNGKVKGMCPLFKHRKYEMGEIVHNWSLDMWQVVDNINTPEKSYEDML